VCVYVRSFDGAGDGFLAILEREEIFIGLGGKCRIIYGNMNVAP